MGREKVGNRQREMKRDRLEGRGEKMAVQERVGYKG